MDGVQSDRESGKAEMHDDIKSGFLAKDALIGQ